MSRVSSATSLQITCPVATPVAQRAVARWALMTFGVVCIALGGLGVFVPGLPTTIFLILACWAFARSNPGLRDRVLRSRLFAPYAKYVDGSSPMPLRARLVSIGIMWTCVGLSLWVLLGSDAAPQWVVWLTLALAVIGTVFIARWQRRPTLSQGQ